MDTPATVPALQSEISTLLRRYSGGARDVLPVIAERVVDLRQHLNDLRGATREYQDTLRAAYDDAGVNRDDRKRIQTAVRYHVDRVQRERLSAEEQAALGLSPDGTFAERKRKQREDIHAALAAAGFSEGSLHDDPLTSLALAVRLLEAVAAAPSLSRLGLVQRATVKALLESVVRHAESAAAIAEGDK